MDKARWVDFPTEASPRGHTHGHVCIHTPHWTVLMDKKGPGLLMFDVNNSIDVPAHCYCTSQREDERYFLAFLFSWTWLLQLFGLGQLCLLGDGPSLVHQKSRPAGKGDPGGELKNNGPGQCPRLQAKSISGLSWPLYFPHRSGHHWPVSISVLYSTACLLKFCYHLLSTCCLWLNLHKSLVRLFSLLSSDRWRHWGSGRLSSDQAHRAARDVCRTQRSVFPTAKLKLLIPTVSPLKTLSFLSLHHQPLM